jgi:predicted transposase/invertase (TIGR01784 family)
MAVFRINRTNDAVFKAVFAKHPKITLALINAFFEFQGTEQIADIEFIDREIDGDLPEDKESRLDVLGRTASGIKVDIEMQVNELKEMGERSLFYWARNYVSLKKGEEYDSLRRTVCINILAFNLLDERKYPKMHSCFGVYDKETGCQLTSQLEIHFLELKKFQSKSVKEMNRMERWAAYFSPVTPEEEIAELAAEDEDIRAAVEVEKMFTQDEVARRKYELAEKFRRDQAAQIRFARDEGLQQGRQDGKDEERLNSIRNLVKNLQITPPQAMDALGIPAGEQGKYTSLL